MPTPWASRGEPGSRERDESKGTGHPTSLNAKQASQSNCTGLRAIPNLRIPVHDLIASRFDTEHSKRCRLGA